MTEKMTLSEMFKVMRQLQSGSTVAHSIKVYRVPHDNLGDVKVMSVVAAKDVDVYRLAELIMTDRLYPKYRDYSVDCTSYYEGVLEIWINQAGGSDENQSK